MHNTDPYPSRQADRPAILERREPVLHGGAAVSGPLSATDLRRFEHDGFLVVDNVLNPHEIDVLRQELEQTCQSLRGKDDPVVISEPGSGDIRSVFMVHQINQTFAGLAAHPRIMSLVQQILDDDVYIHQSRINLKPAFKGKDFYWHSDFETWHVEDGMPAMRAVSCSIPLTVNTAHNGPLMLVPGSHRHFVACVGDTPDDNYKQSLRVQETGTPDDDSLRTLVELGGIEAPLVQPGSVLLFDCNTMHGSSSNITPFARSNAFMVYNALSNKVTEPYGGKRPRPEFVASRETIAPLDARNG
ncbi:ectoine hydroxylase [Iodidimonas sp. SYSU 1G8]|uniref:ectoine hydroxylase n=1 Tax=Iodidimonas sp. SYSU 1G8 TaxID=3133967 RepID=UPI0031FF03CA